MPHIMTPGRGNPSLPVSRCTPKRPPDGFTQQWSLALSDNLETVPKHKVYMHIEAEHFRKFKHNALAYHETEKFQHHNLNKSELNWIHADQKEEKNTVLSPINVHSKRRTPPISGQYLFHWPFSSQILIQNFQKSGHLISGHSNWRTTVLHQTIILAFSISYQRNFLSGQNFWEQALEMKTKSLDFNYLFKSLRNFII